MSKHPRLGDANTNSGYYNYWKRLLTSVNLTTSNAFWSSTRINVSQKRNVMKFRTGTLYIRKLPTSTAEPLIHLVCYVISQTAKFICFLAVRMLQFKTWWLNDITLLPGSSSKPWTNAILEETSFSQILEVKHGRLNKAWSCRHM